MLPAVARFLLVFTFVVGVAPLATARPAASPAPGSPWRPVDSDLPTDPLLRDRVLPNGLRYLILPNAEPKGQVSLRLVVGAGSLQENDDERGLAHFVEHMAFRGTRGFPNGKMAETLQRLGIAFGPDSTAFTSFVHTIFHLEAPTAEKATVRVALHALREYAGEVTFAPPDIERERGVVLSEMATRDTPEARAGDYNLNLLWPKARETRRKVIGLAEQIRGFQRSQFVSFYDAWYRPERLAVIVVGDIDPAEIEAIIKAEFGTLKARAPARPDPADLVTTEAARPNVDVFRDPGAVGMSISFEKARWDPRQADTHDERVRRLREALAFGMFELRLRKLANDPAASFLGPSASVVSGLQNWEVATVGVNGRINDWKAVAMDLELQQRTAIQYGFTAAELEEVRAAWRVRLEQGRRSAATRASPQLAQQLVGTLLNGTVYTTPAALQADLAPALDAITRSECRDAFRAAWLPGAATVYVATNFAFEITRAQLAAVLNESRNQPVQRPADAPVPDFAYTHFGDTGRLTREDKAADLDLRLAEFENGVRFNFKTTSYEADGVEVRVRVGDGKLSQLKSQPGIGLLADVAFTAGGVGRHTRQELNDILAGHAVQLAFQVESDACVFYAHCAPRELTLALRMITAFITDPAYRPAAMRQARADYGSVFADLAASPGGPIRMAATRDMFGDDSRFGIPTFEEFSGRDLGELRAWLDPQLQSGPIETSVVGDVSWDDARAAVAATLGALSKREPVAERTAQVPAVFAPVPSQVKVFPISANLPQVAVAWYWPVAEPVDTFRERRCYLLASAFGERLRLKLREEMGATYAPMAGFVHQDGFPGANYFVFYAEVEPARLEQVLNLLDREALAFSRKGPTEDEFERAKKPYVRAMTDDVRTNAYWGGTVLSDAQQRPARLAAARNRATDISAITRTDLAELAKRYFAPPHAYKYATLRTSSSRP